MPSGSISFPGIIAPIEMTAVRTNGSEPDRAVIWAQPQADSPDCSGTATLSFSFNGVTINWRNALCDNGTLRVTTRGHIRVYTILDSRWKWRRAFVTGHYNARNPDGTVIASSQKTTAQLIQILFARIGVTVDVSLVTDTEYVEVEWDRDNCADMLDQLLDGRGYVVSLTLSDTAKIWPRGQGAALPANSEVVNASFSVDPPELPYTLRAVGARTIVQSMLKCVPVGPEDDSAHTIKEAKDLSYNPGGVGVASGWDGVDLISCAVITNTTKNKLAREAVGRWYQVKTQADGTQDIKNGDVDYVSSTGEIQVADISQLLPVSDKLLTSSQDISGQYITDKAYVLGTVYVEETASNSSVFTPLDIPFDLDKENGIVKFRNGENNDPVLKDVSGVKKFADIYLMCTYSVHPADTLIKDRFLRGRTLGGIGTEQVENKNLERTLEVNYDSSGTVTSITDNQSAVDVAADVMLDLAQAQYVTTAGGVVLYRGVQQFATDGVNLQVQWNCAVKGQTPWGTFVSQWAELLVMLPTSAQRRAGRQTRKRRPPDNPRR